MSLAGNRSRIVTLTGQILRNWQHTKDYWRDAKSEEFGKRYMDELASATNASTGALEQLESIITKIKKDCG
jgi:thymidylate synthase